MVIRKRNKDDTRKALIDAIDKLIYFLSDQNEAEAVEYLKETLSELKNNNINTPPFTSAINKVIEAFEGEHELMAYTYHRDVSEWTEAEELAQASSRVISLAKSFRA